MFTSEGSKTASKALQTDWRYRMENERNIGLFFKFEKKHKTLVAEGEGSEEDRDEYTAENIFFVPPSAR